MGAVYLLTLRQLTGRWRLAIMTALAGLPVFVTMLVLRSDSAPSTAEFEAVVYGAMLAGSIAPLVVLAIATVAFGNELEDRTLANLTLAPIPRWHIAVPKLLAAFTVGGGFILASALITSSVAYLGDLRAVLAVTVALVAAVALYASAFVWLGLVATQAVGVGLLYVVLWEGLFAGFVDGVRMLSIRYHAMALMHGIDPRRFPEDTHVSLVGAAVTIALGCALFLWLTIRRLRRMDIP